MPRPNTSFEISVDEMEIIETALRGAIPKDAGPVTAQGEAAAKAQSISQLLGRLHNQKNFYRPKSRQYISG